MKATHTLIADRLKVLETAVPENKAAAVDALTPLTERIKELEELVGKKAAASMTDAMTKGISRLSQRVSALETNVQLHPLTAALMAQKSRWADLGFPNEQAMVRFATDLPKALKIIAPKPEIAMNATVGRIAEIYPHLGTDEQRLVNNVFPVIFGRPLDEWNKATVDEKSRSMADWSYMGMWKFFVGKN